MSIPDPTKPIKLFISHASEDKADFVRPLVTALQQAGFAVWYDEYELTMGDSLLRKIGEGLRTCDFGIVVLSPSFFRKKWPQTELDGLFALETNERKIILPVWKDVTEEDVKALSPILAGRLGSRTEHGVISVVEDVERAVQAATRTVEVSLLASAIDRLKALDRDVNAAENVALLKRSIAGKDMVKDQAKSVIDQVRTAVSDVAKESKKLSYDLEQSNERCFIFRGSFNLEFSLDFQDFEQLGVVDAIPAICFRACRKFVNEDGLDSRTGLLSLEYNPTFGLDAECRWKRIGEDDEISSTDVASRILSEVERLLREAHQRHQTTIR